MVFLADYFKDTYMNKNQIITNEDCSFDQDEDDRIQKKKANKNLTDFEDSLYRLMNSMFVTYRGHRVEKISPTDFKVLGKNFSNVENAKKHIDKSFKDYKNYIDERRL